MVSYFVGAERKQKMFVDFSKAYEDAKDACKDVNNGETTGINLPNKLRVMLNHAVDAVQCTGLPLDLAAKEICGRVGVERRGRRRSGAGEREKLRWEEIGPVEPLVAAGKCMVAGAARRFRRLASCLRGRGGFR